MSSSEYNHVKYILKENELLRTLMTFAKHSDYCNAKLFEGDNCTCGYSKAWYAWVNRNVV